MTFERLRRERLRQPTRKSAMCPRFLAPTEQAFRLPISQPFSPVGFQFLAEGRQAVVVVAGEGGLALFVEFV